MYGIEFTPKPNCVYMSNIIPWNLSVKLIGIQKIIGQQKLLRGANFRTKEGLLNLSK